MNEEYYCIIAMAVSGGLLASFSIRYHWSRIIWSKINKKMNASLNVAVWMVLFIAASIILQTVLEQFSMDAGLRNVFLGIAAGAMIVLMPNTSSRAR